MLNSSDLSAFMKNHDIEGEIVHLTQHVLTVEDAASAVGTTPDQIVKSLLFLIDGKPVMAIACGTSRVDRRPIAAHYGVGRKRVKLADADTVLEETGYPVGAVPPFGLRQRLPTLIDKDVLAHEEVYAGGGEINALVRVSPQAIVAVTDAVGMDLNAAPAAS
jgi:Cys-tRNA(Pro) deacylase